MNENRYNFRHGEGWYDTWDTNEPPRTPDSSSILWMGWCECGPSDWVEEVLITYLQHLPTEDDLRDPDYDQVAVQRAGIEACGGEALFYFSAYRCDQLGLTTHGGQVTFCWLLPEGEALLKLFDAEVEEEAREATK